MEERTQDSQLKKLSQIAMDTDISSELRLKAIEQLGRVGTHAALLALLELIANEKLVRKERETALKQAGEIIKAGH